MLTLAKDATRMTTIIDSDLGRGSCDLTRTLEADQLRRSSGSVVPEWLLTNGIGGYSSGTVCGDLARRYHGLLVASLPAPVGRAVMLAAMSARVRLPDRSVLWIKGGALAGESTAGEHLTRFTLDSGLPCWTYALGAG